MIDDAFGWKELTGFIGLSGAIVAALVRGARKDGSLERQQEDQERRIGNLETSAETAARSSQANAEVLSRLDERTLHIMRSLDEMKGKG